MPNGTEPLVRMQNKEELLRRYHRSTWHQFNPVSTAGFPCSFKTVERHAYAGNFENPTFLSACVLFCGQSRNTCRRQGGNCCSRSFGATQQVGATVLETRQRPSPLAKPLGFSQAPLTMRVHIRSGCTQPDRDNSVGAKPCLSPPRAWRSHDKKPAKFSIQHVLSDGTEPCGCSGCSQSKEI